MIYTLPLSMAHLQSMLAVERLAHPFPWSEAALASCFGNFYQALGMFDEQSLIGFSVVHCLFEQATLMNICITPTYQGRGHGKLLLQETVNSLPAITEELLLEVRVSNLSAIHLYQQQGFVQTGVRKAYYQTAVGREDALLMVLPLRVDAQV